MSSINEIITIVMKKPEKTQKPTGFFNVGFFEKTHWVQSDRTQSGPPCFCDGRIKKLLCYKFYRKSYNNKNSLTTT